MSAALGLALVLTAPMADLVVTNAKVWTDGRLQTADFIAIRDGKFVRIGKSDKSLIGSETVVFDAKGRVVTPGLIDAHTHLLDGGASLKYELDLRPARNKAELIRMVRERAATLPKGHWLVGNGWSTESYPDRAQPTKEWIDAVTGDRPTVLYRMDGHSAVLNSAALAKAKITKDGPLDPAGGIIDRDPTSGEPTGALRETAMRYVIRPAYGPKERAAGLVAAVAEANRHGVTAVSEVCSAGDIPGWLFYARSPGRSLRASLYLRTADFDSAIRSAKGAESVAGWCRVRGLKVFMDGSLGSRTAAMLEPFTKPLPHQALNWAGVTMPGASDGTYARGAERAANAGLQLAVHAIGDRANREALDLFAGVSGIASKRFRIEHVQHLDPTDVSRFGRLGVVASMQPYHKADDGRYCEEVIGHERSRSSYAYRDLLRSGARLAFGSDWDVVTLNPWPGIDAAVTGKIMTGAHWMTHQDITLDQALDAYTRGAAYAMFAEAELGRIAVGYRADLVVLATDPFKPRTDLSKVRPAAVFVDGRKVK